MPQLKIIPCLALALSIGLFGCSTSNPRPPTPGGEARAYFEQYLDQCGTNEIRCLWFLQDDPRIGMEMTIALDTEKAVTVRDCYNWARQGEVTRTLDDDRVAQLQNIVNHLPVPDKHSQYSSSVFISVPAGNTNKVFQYDRHYTPSTIQQIYGITGGYFYGDDSNL